MSSRKRLVGRIAAIAVIAASLSTLSPAHAAVPPSSSDSGLFGASDPTYDGVVRQSYAILGLVAARIDVPASAVDWLVAQQCDDGSFMSYRSGDCTSANIQTYTGPDTNSTAIAALALTAAGRTVSAAAAARWLTQVHNRDGGWPWMAGLSSDPVSTGMVLQALRTVRPQSPDIASGTRWIRARLVDCDGAGIAVGGMPYSIGGAPDSLSSVEALLGASTSIPLMASAQREAIPTFTCGATTSARLLLARHVARQLLAGDGVMPGMSGGAGWNETALAILGLESARVGGNAAARAVARLARHVDDYVGTGADSKPAALGALLLVTRATGASPRAFGPRDVDLVKRLLATRRP